MPDSSAKVQPDGLPEPASTTGQLPSNSKTSAGRERVELVIIDSEGEAVGVADLALPERDYGEAFDPETYQQRLKSLVTWPIDFGEQSSPEDDWSIDARWPKGLGVTEFVEYLSPDLSFRESDCRDRPKDRWWMWGKPGLDDDSEAVADRLKQRKQRIQSDNFGHISERIKAQILNLRDHWEHDRPAWLDERENDDPARRPSYQRRKSELELWDRSTRGQLYSLIRDLILEKTEPGRELVLMRLPDDKASDWEPLSPGWREKVKYLDWADERVFDPFNSTLTIDGETVEMRVFRAAGETSNSAPDAAGTANVDKGGRSDKFRWFEFYHEAVWVANQPDGLPEQRIFTKHMCDWVSETWRNPPGDSTVRTRCAALYKALAKRKDACRK
jgi:hypothetical protein